MKFSWRGDVVMIVSPSRPQSVVVAVVPNVRALHDCASLLSMLRYSFDPLALFRAIVPPTVKRPEEDSGPNMGVPPLFWR